MKQLRNSIADTREFLKVQKMIRQYKAILSGKKLEKPPTYWALIPVSLEKSFEAGRRQQKNDF